MRVEVVSKMDWSRGGLVAREGERRRVERVRSRLVGGVVVLLGWWWRMVTRRRMLSLGWGGVRYVSCAERWGVWMRPTRSSYNQIAADHAGLVRVVRSGERRSEEAGFVGTAQGRPSCLQGFPRFVVHHFQVWYK